MKALFTWKLVALNAVLLPIAILTTGCGSKFASQEIDPTQKIGNEIGIPYCLSKPIYKLTVKPLDATNYEYEVLVEYVPDFENVYTINLTQGFLSENDFNLTIGENGLLMSTDMARRSQVGPAILSIGKFVGGFIGAATGLDWFSMGVGDLNSYEFTTMTKEKVAKDYENGRYLECLECQKCRDCTEADGKECRKCEECRDCFEKRQDTGWQVPGSEHLYSILRKLKYRGLIWDATAMPAIIEPVYFGEEGSVLWLCSTPASYDKNHWRKVAGDSSDGEPKELLELITCLEKDLFQVALQMNHLSSSLKGLFPLSWTKRLWLETAQKLIDCESAKLNKKLDEKTLAFNKYISMALPKNKDDPELCDDQKKAVELLSKVVQLGYTQILNQRVLVVRLLFPETYSGEGENTGEKLKKAAEELCQANQAAHAANLVKYILTTDKHYRYYAAKALQKQIDLLERYNSFCAANQAAQKTTSGNSKHNTTNPASASSPEDCTDIHNTICNKTNGSTTQPSSQPNCSQRCNESANIPMGPLHCKLEDYRSRLNIIINAQEEAEQEKNLLCFINNVLQSDPTKGKISAVAEYTAANQALVAVRRLKQNKLDKLKPPSAPVGSERTLENIFAVNAPEGKTINPAWVSKAIKNEEAKRKEDAKRKQEEEREKEKAQTKKGTKEEEKENKVEAPPFKPEFVIVLQRGFTAEGYKQ